MPEATTNPALSQEDVPIRSGPDRNTWSTGHSVGRSICSINFLGARTQ